MGTQISANYDNIQKVTTTDLWAIHSANSHVSKEKVCLWVIDVPKLKERYKKKAVRFRYLDVVLYSLQQMRKYRHPRILKILEIAEKKPEIGFSSEPFDKSIAPHISDLHPMDVAYISYQIAEVLSFLVNEARIVHLGLSPAAVLLDDQLSVKLTQFQWSSPVDSQGKVTPSQTYDQLFSEFSDNYVKAPEMLKKDSKLTAETDIFLFGLFLYEAFTGHKFYDSDDPDTILSTLSTRYAQIKGESKIPTDFLSLISACLNPDPSQRPNIANVLQHQAYQSMQLKSLRYIDIMLTKNPSDKFAFYKGLSKKIDEFSPSIQRIKLLPTLINECIADVRFAPILLGAIFQISVRFNTDEFMELVWRKLSVLSTVVSPPEVSIGLLRNLWMLLEKVDKRLHKDYVYPIIFSALNSQDTRIHNEVLKHIDRVIDEMNEETLRSLIMPRLMDLAMNSNNISVSSASIMCISKATKKMDNESFCAEFVPKLLAIWRKSPNPEIAEPILSVFTSLRISLDVTMLRILPIACEVASNNSIGNEIRSKFCNFIIRTAQDFRDKGENEKNFNDQENVGTDKESDQVLTDNDNPFAKPISFSLSKPSSTSNSHNKASSTVNSSPNPFASEKDDNPNPFGSRSTRSHSADSYPSNNTTNTSESPITAKSNAFSDFDSSNPFASAISDKSKNDDEDEDESFGKRKNVFSFSNASNSSKDTFGHSDNINTGSSSRNAFANSDNTGNSSKDVFGNNNNNSVNSSKDVFGNNNNSANSSKSIFGNNSSNLSRKKSDDFDSDSVFSKRDANQNSVQQPKKVSQPFTEDIFKNKAFQETADDVFGTPPSHNDSLSFTSSKPSTSVFNNNSKPSNNSNSSFNNPQISNPSTSTFNTNTTSTNPSTSVFNNNSSSSPPTDFSSNLGLGPISANDIFGSSNVQNSSIDNYISSAFGPSSTSKPAPSPISQPTQQPIPSSGLGMHPSNYQLSAGGFGDFGGYSSPPAPPASSSHQTGSAGSIMNSFGSGLDENSSAVKIGGFGSNLGGNFSSPASMSGFPSVGNNNSSSKNDFNPFQSDHPSHPNIPTPSSHHGSTHGGFNPFQSENGGGGADKDPNSAFNSSGRMIRNPNNAPFQIAQGGMNPPPVGIPRKKPSQSASYDILDIFN